MTHSVDSFLSKSGNAKALHTLDLGQGRRAAIWENRDDEVSYRKTEGHTFSCYLRGGFGTRRLDKGAISGWEGSVCIMPEGHSSDWHISAPFRFVHFYVADADLRAAFSRVHDTDARRLDIEDASFVSRPDLAAPLTSLALSVAESDSLGADAAISEIVSALGQTNCLLSGGLTAHGLKRLDQWLDENISAPIRLSDMAEVLGLSEFHFQRSFTASRGISPSRWLVQKRISRAKALIPSLPFSEIAAACGFADQAHLSRSFKRETGLNPSAYRAALRA